MNHHDATIHEAADLALFAIRQLVTCTDPEEFIRQDKIAQRASHLVHGLTRAPVSPRALVPQEQEGA